MNRRGLIFQCTCGAWGTCVLAGAVHTPSSAEMREYHMRPFLNLSDLVHLLIRELERDL